MFRQTEIFGIGTKIHTGLAKDQVARFELCHGPTHLFNHASETRPRDWIVRSHQADKQASIKWTSAPHHTIRRSHTRRIDFDQYLVLCRSRLVDLF